MARTWTDEQKAKQSALIHRWQPWTHSTGARTPEGKKISSMNVLVGNANRAAALEIAKQELKAVQAKIDRLTRGKEVAWFDKLMLDLTSR